MADRLRLLRTLPAAAMALVAVGACGQRSGTAGGSDPSTRHLLFADTVPRDTFSAQAVPALTDSALPDAVTLEDGPRDEAGRAATLPPPVLLSTRAAMAEAGFEITLGKGRRMELPLESLFALPGEERTIVAAAMDGGGFVVDDPEGNVVTAGPGRWRWTAPEEPGVHPFRLVHRPTGKAVELQGFVMVPADSVRKGRLHGYRIGSYPSRPLRGLAIYEPPRGFVQVTEENCHTRVSPRLRLCQFPAKQGSRYPKYVVLRPQLLLKLELVLDALADRGYPVTSFYVMSGYRTPWYNVSVLGNVPYSRHQWGGAADVFVDEHPKNGVMDDLDGDGRVDLDDARVLYQVVDSLERARPDLVPIGGMGLYHATQAHGPFVHIDARGEPARW